MVSSLIGAVAITVFAACAGSKASPITCESIATPTMISPTNGATGVADGNFSLILSSSGFTIFLTAPGGVSVSLPSPAAASSTQAGVSYAVPALQAATTYSVVASASGGCGPAHPVTIGTFTTQ
jgi:hypothetical protein